MINVTVVSGDEVKTYRLSVDDIVKNFEPDDVSIIEPVEPVEPVEPDGKKCGLMTFDEAGKELELMKQEMLERMDKIFEGFFPFSNSPAISDSPSCNESKAGEQEE